MAKYTKEDIFNLVEEEDVEFIRLQFCDIFGVARNIAITVRQLPKALNNEIAVDTSGLDGFNYGDESEMYLYPDINTFEIFPWRPQTGKVARLICDVYTMNRKPFTSDPRHVLKNVVNRAKKQGLSFDVSPEIEFFLFHLDDNGTPTTITHESAGYLDMAPSDLGENVRRDIIHNLEEMNFEVLSSHHEKAPAQHEIDFAGTQAQEAADMIITFKMAVKTVAKKHGLYATFLPKPTEGVNGSGMHINILAKDEDGKNLFYNPENSRGLSDLAYHFIAGILYHVKAITLVTNPLVNSYKRLVPGYDAPVNIAWSGSSSNRSTLVRIPSQKGESTRIEIRNPDATCNPYLAIALYLAAGLDGIERQLAVPAEVREDLFRKNTSQLRAIGIDMLPQTMGEAIRAYEPDGFVRQVLGDQIFDKLLEAKKEEWREYRTCVSKWELDRYLNQY